MPSSGEIVQFEIIYKNFRPKYEILFFSPITAFEILEMSSWNPMHLICQIHQFELDLLEVND